MKTFASKAPWLAAVAVVLLAGQAVVAQIPGAGPSTGVTVAFVKLFGPFPAFTAKVEARVFDPYQQETVRMPMEWAVLEGKVRLEANLEQMKTKDMPTNMVASLLQAGMTRIVSVFRPDKKATYVIYPGIQSYQNLPLPQAEVEALEKGLKLEKTGLGKETIDGHACVKNKVIVRNGKGPVLEVKTWNAADLKDFPVQIEMKEKHNTVRMRFTQVQFAKPDAKQFEVPASYGQMK